MLCKKDKPHARLASLARWPACHGHQKLQSWLSKSQLLQRRPPKKQHLLPPNLHLQRPSLLLPQALLVWQSQWRAAHVKFQLCRSLAAFSDADQRKNAS